MNYKTLEQFLDYLTDNNRHSERVLVEAIVAGREWVIGQACRVVLQHYKDGYLTDKNWERRQEIIKALNEE